jgi:hypothetical protein
MLESVLDQLAPIFEQVPAVDGERDGALLLVSGDAGVRTTLRFWGDALSAGVAFASPGAFPWCLANAPSATLARRFGLTGPVVTWLAPSNDRGDPLEGPSAWLADYLDGGSSEARMAWLVSLHFGGDAPRVDVWRWGSGFILPG